MNLHIPSTDRTPEVQFVTNPWRLTIQGESYPEDVAAFYGPVIHAIKEFNETAQGALTVDLAMVYINSSSIKALYRIFEGVDAYRCQGHDVHVVWRVPEDDDIMQELGEDFKDRFPDLAMQIEAH